MTKKTLIWVVVAVVIVIIGYLYGTNNSAQSTKQTVESGPIRIGASISMTGAAAPYGEMSKKAMDMAVDEINANGGMNGRKVELYIEDDHTVPKDTVSAWRKLVDVNKVDAVIGGLFDFTAQPLFPLAEKENITFVSPINFAIKGKFEMNKNSFVMYPEFEYAISKLDNVIKGEKTGDKISKVGMVRYQSDYGAEIERVLSGMIDKAGKQKLTTETYTTIGGSDFRTQIAKMKQKGIDTIFLDMLDFDIVTFLKRADEQNYKPQIIGYTTVRDVVGKTPLVEGAIMLDWEIQSDAFAKKFEEKYGIKSLKGANKSYDAVYVVAEAIANSKANNKAGAGDQGAVAKYIESHTFKTIDGVTEFTKDHSVSSTPIKIMQVKDGALVEIN